MARRNNFPRFKAAAVQASPIVRNAPEWFDLEATVDKATRLIKEASNKGARLIVFPECWIPCYPYWCLDLTDKSSFDELGANDLRSSGEVPGRLRGYRDFNELWANYLWNSVEVPSKEVAVLGEAARRANAYVVIGINERDPKYAGRMYNSILYLDSSGEVIGVHRKICITVQERLFHTPGNGGDNLKAVFKTEIGNLGGSICGEHVQLLLIYNWIMQGLEVHCSLWPGTTGLENYIDIATRALCRIGRVFGVMSSTYFSKEDTPKNFYTNSFFNIPGSIRGGSGIVNPAGEYIAGPVFDEETIVYGDIDLSDIDKNRFINNLLGYYSRWDLLSLNVREEIYEPLFPMEISRRTVRYPESDRIEILEARMSELEEKISGISLKAATGINQKTSSLTEGKCK